jgi:hypothetical protein
MRALLEGGYVARNSDLSVASGVPAEVVFTDRTRSTLEGLAWTPLLR